MNETLLCGMRAVTDDDAYCLGALVKVAVPETDQEAAYTETRCEKCGHVHAKMWGGFATTEVP